MEFLDNKPSSLKEQDLTPLINIVFLMLIFFMLSAAIAPSSDNTIELITSSVEAAQPSSVGLTISIDKSGAIFEQGQLVTVAQFGDRLKQLATAKDNSMAIKADARLDANVLVELLASATDAGITSASIMTIRP